MIHPKILRKFGNNIISKQDITKKLKIVEKEAKSLFLDYKFKLILLGISCFSKSMCFMDNYHKKGNWNARNVDHNSLEIKSNIQITTMQKQLVHNTEIIHNAKK